MEEMIGFVVSICVLMTINVLMAARAQNNKGRREFLQWGHLTRLRACEWRLRKEGSRQHKGCGQWQALGKHNHKVKSELIKQEKTGGMQRYIAMLLEMAKRNQVRHHSRPLHQRKAGVDPPHLKRRGLNLIVYNQRLRAEIEEGGS